MNEKAEARILSQSTFSRKSRVLLGTYLVSYMGVGMVICRFSYTWGALARV